MGDLSLEKVSETYLDVLQEIGNIGAGNAMTALSQMLNCKVDMKVPQVKLLDFNEVGAMMGGEEQVMVGVFLGVEGDITGSMMFLVEQNSAKHLLHKILGDMVQQDGFSEIEFSAMKEIGNIITGAYLNSLSMLTNLTIIPTPPSLTLDMAGAILSVPAIEFGTLGDKILLIQSQFYDEVEIDGYFILVPDIESYPKILSSLGVSVEEGRQKQKKGSRMSEIIKVGMADLKTCVSPDGVTTLGLGSCVGIAIRDPVTKIGGLAHIMLPDSTTIRNSNQNIAKFADTGIDELVRQMEKLGARKARMVAKIAGGATMFTFQGRNDMMQVGERNVEAVKKKLKEISIPILAEDTGKNYGRTVTFYPETGEFHIRAVGRDESVI